MFEDELKIAKQAAVEIGKMQLELFRTKYHVIRKSPKELVSKVDIESQKKIEQLLKKEHKKYEVFSEEKSIQKAYPSNDLFWIVDPLDGTHNYIAGLPFFGVSIALADINKFYIGVIYLPGFDSLFWALKGRGAYCNDKKIEISHNDDISKSLITYDNQFYLASKSFEYYKKLVEKTFTTRIIGSAIYDICLVASGIVDARIYNSTKIYDIAAGITIISEAGGRLTDFNGNNLTLSVKDVIASNGKIHNALLEIFNSD